MDDFDFIVRAQGGVARIDLNRPEEGNALTRAMMVRLASVVREAAADSANRVLVLEGRGDHFCRGRDGKGETTKGLTVHQIRTQMMGATLGAYEAIETAPLPVVALVHATATGFGAALAAACDITLAASDARFSFPEIKHGIPPTMAMAALLHKIPPKTLAYLIYSGAEISATEALGYGLVSRVIAREHFQTEADAFLSDLASRPRLNLETIKKYQHEAADLSARMASEYAGTLMAVVRS